jgi:hypothetical protein
MKSDYNGSRALRELDACLVPLLAPYLDGSCTEEDEKQGGTAGNVASLVYHPSEHEEINN